MCTFFSVAWRYGAVARRGPPSRSSGVIGSFGLMNVAAFLVAFTTTLAGGYKFWPDAAEAAEASPLELGFKIPLGDVVGRIDHMAIDLGRQRLFVAELGNNSVSIAGLKE